MNQGSITVGAPTRVLKGGFLEKVTSRGVGRCQANACACSLSKALGAGEHILTDSGNCHKYLLQGGVRVWECRQYQGTRGGGDSRECDRDDQASWEEGSGYQGAVPISASHSC